MRDSRGGKEEGEGIMVRACCSSTLIRFGRTRGAIEGDVEVGNVEVDDDGDGDGDGESGKGDVQEEEDDEGAGVVADGE